MTRDRGSAAVEFVLVLPVVLALLLATVEVAVAARVQLEVTQAARQGAREAATTPDPLWAGMPGRGPGCRCPATMQWEVRRRWWYGCDIGWPPHSSEAST